ncbi:MAG: methyltransferase domain-containing protein [bacterium]|jgi:ubiquinone/menaquinone biosynthesis C-methylase UbiE|nr:MAG: methyltransferase type 11 [bacterium]
MLSRREIRAKYDAVAGVYDRLEAIAEWLGVRALRREAFGRARGRVLEVAIGTGKNLPCYPPEVEEIIGVDLSPAMLRVARRRAEELGMEVALLEADAEALPFPDASFDTVASSLSTCTFPDPVRALSEMRRVCKPDGQILLLEHGRSRSPWIARFQDRRADAHARVLGCRWNREPLELVRDAGLAVRHARRTFFGILHLIVATPA